MDVPRRFMPPRPWRPFVLASATACSAVHGVDAGRVDAPPPLANALDLLLVVDNTGSMGANHRLFGAQLPSLVEQLLHPADRNGDGRPDLPPVASLHVGVVSTDLGGPEPRVTVDCSGPGDDGRLNPLRHGSSLQRNAADRALAFGRPADCGGDSRADFLAFDGASSVERVVHDVRCQATLDDFGCGIEQPLEAAFRALTGPSGSGPLDAGAATGDFLRPGAALAILLVTDEDDASIRDCRRALPASPPCSDAMSVFDGRSTAWASPDLNLRTYLYQPCGDRDPTWPLERYVDPSRPAQGLLGLKPGHPERIVFGAITGVPLDASPTDGSASNDWDALLGLPGAGADDYCGRLDQTAAAGVTPEGSYSMRARRLAPGCDTVVGPACRREGSAPSEGCSTEVQYRAFPARRIVEIARRFDQAPLCGGAPCRNGVVMPICARDFRTSLVAFAERVQRRVRQVEP